MIILRDKVEIKAKGKPIMLIKKYNPLTEIDSCTGEPIFSIASHAKGINPNDPNPRNIIAMIRSDK